MTNDEPILLTSDTLSAHHRRLYSLSHFYPFSLLATLLAAALLRACSAASASPPSPLFGVEASGPSPSDVLVLLCLQDMAQ